MGNNCRWCPPREGMDGGPQARAGAARLPRGCPEYVAGVGGGGRTGQSHTHKLLTTEQKKEKAKGATHRNQGETLSPPARALQRPLLETLASCVCVKSLQSCRTVCDPVNCSPPGSSVHGILQVRILEWVTMPFSRDLPDPGIEPASLMSPVLAGRFFTTSATWAVLGAVKGHCF